MARCVALLVAWLALFAFVPTAHALECGTHLVVEGDTSEHLVASCGPPTQRSGGQSVRGRYGVRINDEVWTYDFGVTRDRVVITLRRGVIIAIRLLGPGTPR